MSKKRGQTEAERARIARELVAYMLEEEEEEPQNPAIDREQLADAVPEQTTGVNNVNEEVVEYQLESRDSADNVNKQVEHDQHQLMDSNDDNGLEFLASILSSYPDLALDPVEASVPDVAASAVPVATSVGSAAESVPVNAASDLADSPHSPTSSSSSSYFLYGLKK